MYPSGEKALFPGIVPDVCVVQFASHAVFVLLEDSVLSKDSVTGFLIRLPLLKHVCPCFENICMFFHCGAPILRLKRECER